MPDVIDIRNEILPAQEREVNFACDLNDFSWMDRIDAKMMMKTWIKEAGITDVSAFP